MCPCLIPVKAARLSDFSDPFYILTSTLYSAEAALLTYRSFMRNCVHAEGQLFFWILLEFFPLRECFGYHLALFDAFWLIVTASNDPWIEGKQLVLLWIKVTRLC